MPKRCVVAGCGNASNKEKGVSLHIIPYSGDERNEARKRRKKWVDFVKLKRAKWQPAQYSIICSEHFKPDAQLLKENRQLTNRVKTLREIVGKRRKEVKAYRRKRKNNNYFVFPLH